MSLLSNNSPQAVIGLPGLQASLEAGQYDLASELLRFLIPPGDNDILAAMPSHAPMHDHSSGKHPQSAANQDAGVSLLHSDLSTLSDQSRLRSGLKGTGQIGTTLSALTQARSSTFIFDPVPKRLLSCIQQACLHSVCVPWRQANAAAGHVAVLISSQVLRGTA